MIAYVDTSTLLKLVIDEDGSDRATTIWTSADSVASVSLIVVEARAALAAAMRGQRLTTEQYAYARDELDALLADLHVVEVSDGLIADAAELAERDGLRGYDAVHLAAAITDRGDRAEQRRRRAVRRSRTTRPPRRQPAGVGLTCDSAGRPRDGVRGRRPGRPSGRGGHRSACRPGPRRA